METRAPVAADRRTREGRAHAPRSSLAARRGTGTLDLALRVLEHLAHRSHAHGKVWLAFSSGPAIEQALVRSHSGKSGLAQDIAKVRRRGWATAPSEVIDGVNALAAPVLDHSARMVGSIAIVGATQFIPPEPSRAQIEDVVCAALRISRALRWK